MLGVVVDKHVVWDCELRSFHWNLSRDDDLKPPHVPRISCILQTVLIAFQEELEKVSIDDHRIWGSFVPVTTAFLVTASTIFCVCVCSSCSFHVVIESQERDKKRKQEIGRKNQLLCFSSTVKKEEENLSEEKGQQFLSDLVVGVKEDKTFERQASFWKTSCFVCLLTCTWLHEWGGLDTSLDSCPVLHRRWLVESPSQSTWHRDFVLAWLRRHSRVGDDSGFRY